MFISVSEYDPEKEIKPLKQEKILLKKENKRENKRLIQEKRRVGRKQ